MKPRAYYGMALLRVLEDRLRLEDSQGMEETHMPLSQVVDSYHVTISKLHEIKTTVRNCKPVYDKLWRIIEYLDAQAKAELNEALS